MISQSVEAQPLITLVGPPNSGKTTLFNFLSGQNFKTVNYPGATVEYSISRFLDKFKINAHLLDSPGIISLLPSSPDEEVSVNALYSHPKLGIPDIVITTVDASQLSRHLFLVRQLIESDFNVIIALTMTDILRKKGYAVSAEALSEEIKCDVVVIDARTGAGHNDLLNAINRNLEQLTLTKKKKPARLLDSDKASLVDAYKQIEKIEKKVIYKSNGNVNLDLANAQLKILTNPAEKENCHKIDETTLKIDRILLHRIWGLLAFFAIMAFTFTSIFWLAEPLMSYIDDLFGFLSEQSFNLLGNNWFGDLISNGIISGSGSVLVFLPQIIILFLILGLLEDTGYLARGAMLIDKPLSKIGLNGKSFVPMLSGFACAIPAMLATRTIPNKRERFLTIFILPLMSCSARLPVYALLIGFLIPGGKSWIGGIVLAAIYIFSIVSSVAVAAIINKFRDRLIHEVDNSSFILELPAYRKPQLKVVIGNTINSAKVYLRKAGPAILFFSLALWFLTYFPNNNPNIETDNLSGDEIVQLQNSERLAGSYAAGLGKFIQPVMEPIGMDWRVGVSLIAAFAAREVFVSSLALIFKVTNDDDTMQESMLEAMRQARVESTGEPLFTTATITGLIVFFIFALQCISTLVVSKNETGGWRIPIMQLVVFTSAAYIFTFIVVNGLRALGVN
ncbi:MAG: ferrous iron transport protein B [Ignavibacteriaceae bacterium]